MPRLRVSSLWVVSPSADARSAASSGSRSAAAITAPSPFLAAAVRAARGFVCVATDVVLSGRAVPASGDARGATGVRVVHEALGEAVFRGGAPRKLPKPHYKR